MILSKFKYVSFAFISICILYITCNKDDDDIHNTDNVEPVVIFLFMTFGLGIGLVLQQILSKYRDPVPYTVVVFIAGMIFSLANKENAGAFGESVAMWGNINADIFLFVFLPPLVFGEAMNLNWHHIIGGFWQAVLLAGPGVLIGCVLIGVIAKYLLNWSWNLAMIFGAILSATDPVAVVALLKSAGASPKLTILIVGESLLNDGSAMVLFTIFLNALNGTRYTVSGIIFFFFAAAIGSLLLGIFIGFLTIRWLRTANRSFKEVDVTVQIGITMCCAYVTFFIAQYSLRISGVLACCGAGGMLAWLGPPLILNRETMHNVWSMIEWVLNTFVFLLAGLIMGNRIVEKVQFNDVGYMILFYVLLMAVRCIVLLILFPIVSRIGHKCTVNETIFMSWAGLRGALGIILALIVHHDGPDDLSGDTDRLFFYVGGIASLTLLINATTAKKLLVLLNLLGDDSLELQLVSSQVRNRIKKVMTNILEDMCIEFSLNEKDLINIQKHCTIFHNLDIEYTKTCFENKRKNLISKLQSTNEHNTVGRDTINNDKNENESDPKISFSMKTSSILDSIIKNPMREKAVSVKLQNDLKTVYSFRNSEIGDYNPSLNNIVVSPPPQSSNVVNNNNENTDNDDVTIDDYDFPPIRTQSIISKASPLNDVISSLHDDRGSINYGTGSKLFASSNDLVNLLNMTDRISNHIYPKLLAYIRTVFLEIVKVKYWNNIEQGILPQLSYAATFLLYSIEVGLDKVEEAEGPGDWLLLYKTITNIPFYLRLWSQIDRNLHYSFTLGYSSYFLAKYISNEEKRKVYLLSSFISAHEEAQDKIHDLLLIDKHDRISFHASNSDVNYDSIQQVATPEELKVINESKEAVAMAKNFLNAIDRVSVETINSVQVILMLLTKEVELIKSMVNEGLLSENYAEEFLGEISKDMQHAGSYRYKRNNNAQKTLGKLRRFEKKDIRSNSTNTISITELSK